MGYDLHITRRKQWTDAGDDITASEWLNYVAGDAEMKLSSKDGRYWAAWSGSSALPQPWLDWEDGTIYTKNPDEALVRKMCMIARALSARVQGDDGEFYGDDGNPLPAPKASLGQRIIDAFRRPTAPPPRPAPPPDFAVGDRIQDVWGRDAIISAIDLHANHGLGSVSIRYQDGREVTFALGSNFRKTPPRTT